MRAQLSTLHQRLGTTTVYVTHDRTEAMTLGRRVAVLRDGVLQQCDTPQPEERAQFTVRLPADVPASVGQPLTLAIDPQRLHFFDPDTGLAR